jgi:hypothetical protein
MSQTLPDDLESVVERLRTLIAQARSYLPQKLCGELVMAMFDYCDLQAKQSKRELRAAFGGRGPDPTTDYGDEVSA